MKSQPLHVLLVESDAQDAALVQEALAEMEEGRHWRTWMHAVQLVHVESAEEAEAVLESQPFDVVLLSSSVQDGNGLHTFLRIHQHSRGAPIIVLATPEDEGLAIAAVREGAQDYLIRSEIDCLPLARSIRYALERRRLTRTLEQLTMRDIVTGLYSQGGFFALAERDLRVLRQVNQPAAMLIAQVDSSSISPDDRSLAMLEIGELLRGAIREADLLGRIGDTRLGVLAAGATAGQVGMLASRIERLIQERNARAGTENAIPVRIEVVDLDAGGVCTLDELVGGAPECAVRE